MDPPTSATSIPPGTPASAPYAPPIVADVGRFVRSLTDPLAWRSALPSVPALLQDGALDPATAARVLAASLAPLLWLEPTSHADAACALDLLTALRPRFADARSRRRAWAAQAAGTSGESGSPRQEFRAGLAFTARTLRAACERIDNGLDPELPEALQMERCADDLAQALAIWVVPRWQGVPEVLEALLGLLSKARTIRSRAGSLLRLALGPEEPERVQRAGIRFVQAWLTGATTEDAAARRASDGPFDALHPMVVEADTRTRATLARVALDPGRPIAVREDALRAILQVRPPPGELLPLLERTMECEETLAQVALGWVAAERSHLAFDVVVGLRDRLPTLAPETRALWYRALAATRHAGVGAVVADALPPDREVALAALAGAGAPGRTQQIRALLAARADAQEAGRAGRQRLAEHAEMRSLLGEALTAATRVDVAAVDAERWSSSGMVTALVARVEGASLREGVFEALDALEAALGRRAAHRKDLAQRLHELRAMRAELGGVREVALQAQQAVDRLLRDREAARRKLDTAVAELRGAERREPGLRRRVEDLTERLAAATAEREAVGESDEDAGRAAVLDRQLRDVERQLGTAEDELEATRSRLRAIPDQIRALQEALSVCHGHVDGLLRKVEEARGPFLLVADRQHLLEVASAAAMEAADSVGTEIAPLLDAARRLRDDAHRAAARARDELDSHARRLDAVLGSWKEAQAEMGRCLDAVTACEDRLNAHAARMIELHQRSAERLAAVQEGIDEAARELGRADARAALAEADLVRARRLEQDLKADVDLLLIRLHRVAGPVPEVAAVVRALGLTWPAGGTPEGETSP